MAETHENSLNGRKYTLLKRCRKMWNSRYQI